MYRSLIKEGAQPAPDCGMAQLAQGVGFDLAHTLARDSQLRADRLKCALLTAEIAQAQNARFTLRQLRNRLFKRFAEQRCVCSCLG
jgi:hypothetical protein